MKQQDRTFPIRMNVLLMGLFVWGAVIVYRLVDLQIVHHDEMVQKAENLHRFEEKIPARRGEILDANGRILAISQKEPYIFADPKLIEDPEQAAALLAQTLGRDRRWQKRQATVFANKKRRFAYVAKRISESHALSVRELKIRGIHVAYKSWRTYPGGWLASHVLGFMSADGGTKEGLESQLDNVMRGTPGKRIVMRDGRKQRLTLGGEDPILQEPEDGAAVQLTLDANIQFFVENALRRALEQTKAKNITAIVMDPRDGRILAMANVPDFNPNQFGKFSAFERKNRAVVDVYEPASAFKIITAAVGLETGRVRLTDMIDCQKSKGGIQVYDKFIRDHKPFGILSVAEVLWHSSNVGSVKISQKVPEEQFYHYIQKFGFGQETAIDLPAESNGILRPLSEWSKVSSSFLSLGHEISVTPLQMLRAASVVANRGRMVHPYIVENVIYADGRVEPGKPRAEPVQVISPETAGKLVQALRGVVTDGTAKAAAIEGIDVFGKTGTAQRLQGSRYSRKSFNASFVGFFPVEQPRYGMMIVVHDPKGRKKHGGEVAAPIFAEIGEQIVAYDQTLSPRTKLPVYVSTPDWMERATIPAVVEGKMPDLSGLGLRNVLHQCRLLGLEVEIEGRGKVMSQWPAAGAVIPEDRTCGVVLGTGYAGAR